MEQNQDSLFPADKVAAMLAARAEYSRTKKELLFPVVKTTPGKQNTLDTASAALWLPFGQENPTKITDKADPQKFADALAADKFLVLCEKIEAEDARLSKVYRDIVSSDIRCYWTTTEDYYIEAAKDDPLLAAKYGDLPTISPKRKSESEIQNAFDKLQARRNKKKGGDSAATTT